MKSKLCLVVLCLLLDCSWIVAQSHPTSTPLGPYVQQASEFSSRARANVYFPNLQSIFNGVQVGFVNVGTGNLTFLRRDTVASGRIPIVLARVYDSSGAGSTELGSGWRFSATEAISVGSGKAHLLTESDSVIDFVTNDGKTFQLEKDYPSDYTTLVMTAPDTFQAALRTGFHKEFTFIAGEFRLTKVVDRNGNALRLSYQGSTLSRLENANHWIALTADKTGHIVSAKDDQQRTVSYAYDGQGRLTEVDDLGGQAWRYSYTENGRLQAATDPLQRQNLSVLFDDAGRVQRLQLASGTIQYAYDPSSGLTTVIDRRKLTSRFFQNAEGITTSVVNALGEETSIGLDSGRNVISLARNGSVVEIMQYDQQHRLVSRQSSGDSGNVDRQYSYDPASGLLSGIQTSTGASQHFGYDPNGNLADANLPDGLHTFNFSSAGDLTGFSAGTRKLTFTPDPGGLMSSMTDETRAVTTMRYKAGSELAEAHFPDRTQAKYEYQPSGLRSKMVYKDGHRVEYSYDPAGNLTGTKVFDTKGKQTNGQTLEMNDSYQLTRWVLFDGTETNLRYDPNGNLKEIKKGKSITRFEYDALDRLTAVVTPTGQRLTYSYKPGERSLIEQYEHAAIHVADVRDTGFTFAGPLAASASRPLASTLGSVRFSETLGTFQLANADGSEIVRPQEAIEGALAQLRLYAPDLSRKALLSGFGAPFNNMFIPSEYLTINCCPECYYDGEEWYCPPCSGGGGNPNPPVITQIDPDVIMIGSNNVQVTISGSGFGTFSTPTVNLPQGVTNQSSGGSSDSTIVITVNATLNSTIGINTLNVVNNDNGLGSDPAEFTIDGPNQLVVQNDVIGFCPGCHTTVERDTTYQILNFSGSLPGALQICETPHTSGWNCTQANPGLSAAFCGTNPFNVPANDTFTDSWSMASDAYIPVGCGENDTDFWDWVASPGTFLELGTLIGYLHTNSIEIDSSIMPPQANRLPNGTVIPH